MNLYRYVGNNASTLVDPMGLIGFHPTAGSNSPVGGTLSLLAGINWNSGNYADFCVPDFFLIAPPTEFGVPGFGFDMLDVVYDTEGQLIGETGVDGFDFQAYVEQPVIDNPFPIATADFDLDGNLDIVTASVSAAGIEVLFGNGAGGFSRTVTIAASHNPVDLAVGDVNDDGYADIVASGLVGGAFSVILNLGVDAGQDGDWDFAAPVDYQTPLWHVALADVNGDWELDIVGATATAVFVFANNGTGTFDAGVSVASGFFSNDIDAGDLNQDGYADIVLAATPTNSVKVILSTGAGTFASPVNYSVSAPVGVNIGYFTSDSNLDVAATLVSTGKVAVLPGSGDGTLGAPILSTVGGVPLAGRWLSQDCPPSRNLCLLSA